MLTGENERSRPVVELTNDFLDAVLMCFIGQQRREAMREVNAQRPARNTMCESA